MRTLALTLSCCCLALTACDTQDTPTTNTPPPPAIEDAILGTWETIEIEAKAPTYEGRDTSVHHLIEEADWSRAYGVRPAQTVFTPDGKLVRTHRLANGQVADVTNGLWRAQGTDTLLFIEPNKTFYYAYDLEGSRLELRGTIDWDYDGEADDDYRAVLRQIARTE